MDSFFIGIVSRVVRFITGFNCEKCRREFSGNGSYYVCEDDHNAFCTSCSSEINHRCSRCNSYLKYLS